MTRLHRFMLSAVLCFTTSLCAQTNSEIISFDIMSPAKAYSKPLPNDYKLVITKSEQGWDIAVYKGNTKDNLLYPQKVWHGAFPCQISAWSHFEKTFPDTRIIPVRDTKNDIVITLNSVKSSKHGDKANFNSGTIKINYATRA